MNSGEKLIGNLASRKMSLDEMVNIALSDMYSNIATVQGQGAMLSRENMEKLSSRELRKLAKTLQSRCHTIHHRIKENRARITKTKAFHIPNNEDTGNALIQILLITQEEIIAQLDITNTRNAYREAISILASRK